MMQATTLALRGLGATLGVQLWLALSAALPAALVGPLLERRQLPVDAPRELLEYLALSPERALAMAAPFAVALCWQLLTRPAVQLAWMHALDRGSTRGSLRFAFACYLPAVRQSVVIAVVGTSGAVALAGLPAWAADRLVQQPEPVRLTYLALSALPLAAWLLLCGTWHDVSRGQLAVRGESELRDVLRLWTVAWHPARLVGFALQAVGTLALAACAAAALSHRGLTGLLLAQGALLARGFVRSLWLAHVVRLAEPVGPR